MNSSVFFIQKNNQKQPTPYTFCFILLIYSALKHAGDLHHTFTNLHYSTYYGHKIGINYSDQIALLAKQSQRSLSSHTGYPPYEIQQQRHILRSALRINISSLAILVPFAKLIITWLLFISISIVWLPSITYINRFKAIFKEGYLKDLFKRWPITTYCSVVCYYWLENSAVIMDTMSVL